MNDIQNEEQNLIDKQLCLLCGKKGKLVKAITVDSLVSAETCQELSTSEGFRFCSTQSCSIAYYNSENNEQISKENITVRVGQKEAFADRSICYCFHHTAQEIEEDFIENASSTILDDIKEKCKQGQDKCAENNPQGSCCLGNVNAVLKPLQNKKGLTVKFQEESCCGQDNCSSEKQEEIPVVSNKKHLKLAGGALVAALLASACCWLPLVLLVFGASAVGVSTFFEEYRILFLAITALFLVASFYYVYFRKATCQPGDACSVPNPRTQKFNKTSLWFITVLVFIFALFPNYIGALIGTGKHLNQQEDLQKVSISISGMTCEACSAKIDKALELLPEVEAAEVNFTGSKAVIVLQKGAVTPHEKIIRAIEKSGSFKAKFIEKISWEIGIEGMTCEGCTTQIRTRLSKINGVHSTSVNYQLGNAIVIADSSVSEVALRQAIAELAYSVKSLNKNKVE